MPTISEEWCSHCNDNRACYTDEQPGVTYIRCIDCGRIVDTVWDEDDDLWEYEEDDQ